MKEIVFDASALLVAVKCMWEEKRICEHLVEYAEIHIAKSVRDEMVVDPEKFPDEASLQALISHHKIIVDAVESESPAPNISTGFRMSRSEKDTILLYWQNRPKFDAIVFDDYVATMACRRMQIRSMHLLEFIVQLAKENLIPDDLATAMVTQIASYYHQEFVKQSLQALGKPELIVPAPPGYVKEDLERYLAGKWPVDETGPPAPKWLQQFAQLYRDYAAGTISLGWMAQQLQIPICTLDRWLEKIELPLSTGLDELFELWEPHRASSRWLKLNREAN